MDIKKEKPEFYDDEFGVYYDGEFYEEVDDKPSVTPAGDRRDNSALLKEIESLREEIKNIGKAAQAQPQAEKKPFFIKKNDSAAPAAAPKPVTPPKAHSLAKIIANRMIMDSMLAQLADKDITRAQRDKIIGKLVPGAKRLDDQPKDIMKIANTLVTDKLTKINKQYEKTLKLRDKEIRAEAKAEAARIAAEKKAAYAEGKKDGSFAEKVRAAERKQAADQRAAAKKEAAAAKDAGKKKK